MDSPIIHLHSDNDQRFEDNELDFNLPKYELRPQAREAKSVFSSTWIDRDESGTYGKRRSKQELLRARLERERVNARKRNYAQLLSEENDASAADDESTPRVIPRFMITLSFGSEPGQAKFNGYISSLPAEDKSKEQGTCDRHGLRKRDTAHVTRYYTNSNLDKSRFAPDLPDDLTGHPCARGCWECLSLGIRCSLLDDERSWPCHACASDDHECELITPLSCKRACERCKRRRTACSYSSTANHTTACQQCMDDGYRCVAGPGKDADQRIRLGREWHEDPLPKKQMQRLISMAVDSGSQDDNVLSPHSAARDITPVDMHEVEAKTRLVDIKPAALMKTKPSPSRPSQHHQRFGLPTPLKKIRTKFCHPIQLNYQDKTNGQKPCHFCTEPAYAIFGLGAKDVEVIECPDGSFEEHCGGHKGDCVESTRICPSCTLKRLVITMCKSHELQPIPGGEKALLDSNAAFAELLSESTKTNRKWCSICPSLASCTCCTPSEGCSAGCGLLLCKDCVVIIKTRCGGDLQKVPTEVKDEPPQTKLFGLRADFDLLKLDGLLMAHVLRSN